MNDTQETITATQTDVIPGTEVKPEHEIKNALVPYEALPADEQQSVEGLIAQIDVTDRTSILSFGSEAQEQMTDISEKMLEGVKNKDLGGAGNVLNDMVTTIKGFDIDKLNPNRKQAWWERLFGKAKPVVQFLNRYDDVRDQIDTITDSMEEHKTELLTDIVTLDKLYEANLDFFHRLEQYISAGEEKIKRLESTELPELEAAAQANAEDMLAAQALRDMRGARDDLERRIHDLRLTRQVAMQSLPSIRLVQENDKMLINKINSTLINTVPLWKNQLAQAVTVYRMSDAAETVQRATDLTNELLESNAANLRTANQQVREQMERGVFDVESVRKANNELIATINDSLRIAEEGKTMRAKAEVEVQTMESELRQALIAAKAKPEPQAEPSHGGQS